MIYATPAKLARMMNSNEESLYKLYVDAFSYKSH